MSQTIKRNYIIFLGKSMFFDEFLRWNLRNRFLLSSEQEFKSSSLVVTSAHPHQDMGVHLAKFYYCMFAYMIVKYDV